MSKEDIPFIKQLQTVLITILLGAFAVWAMWTVIKPMIPFIVVGLFLAFILGLIFRRTSRW